MAFTILPIIIAVTVIVSLLAFNNSDLRYRLMYIPYRVKHNREHVRTFTHLFIHADYMHLFFNMFSLYALGSAFLSSTGREYVGVGEGLISTYGALLAQLHFAVLYFLGGLFATLIPYLRNQDNPNYLSLGASGAVSSVIFASIIWNPQMQLSLFFLPSIPAYIFGPLYILFEIYMDKRGNTGVAHDAHIGGAIFGIVYILIVNIDKGKELIDLIV